MLPFNGIMCSTSWLKYGFNASSSQLEENGFGKCQYERMTTVWIRLLWMLNAKFMYTQYIVKWHPHENRLFNKLRGIRNFEIGMFEVHAPRWIMDNGTPVTQLSKLNRLKSGKWCTIVSSDRTKCRCKWTLANERKFDLFVILVFRTLVFRDYERSGDYNNIYWFACVWSSKIWLKFNLTDC